MSNNMELNVWHKLLVSLFLVGNVRPQSSCGDWTAYKDETCIKIFYAPQLLMYDDAKGYCTSQESTFMTIDSQEKQDFVENHLKSNEVAENVWLGLKYSEDNGYQWLDGTQFEFSNWAVGSPKNNESYCVEIHTEEEDYGKWSEVSCNRKNLVVCEKLQLWSALKVQKTLMNLVKNPPVPMGFIYVQLPQEKLPSEVWPLLGWEDVTSNYAGVFFRAEGGNSLSFGEIQEENAPRLVNVLHEAHIGNGYVGLLALDADGEYSPGIRSGVHDDSYYNAEIGLKFRVSTGEVRPRNMAVRIWKRVK